jgi:CBS domain-containing protein
MLPAYELALMLASHAEAARLGDLHIALVTPEDQPLSLFGSEASEAIRALLEERRIALHNGYLATEVRDGRLELLPPRELECDCVIALPTLRGQRIDGIPQTRDGFVLVDDHGRVAGLADVYAAGDITRFPVKQGGLAAQQADAAAEAIAADAGVLRDPEPFRPVLRGVLLTGAAPRYLRRDVSAGRPGTAAIDPLWWPPAKIVGRHLSPFLAGLAGERHDELPPVGIAVDVELAAPPEPPPEDDEGPRIGDLVGPPPLVVAPEDTLGEVAERMEAVDMGSALVADSGRLIGILTSRDLLRAFAGRIHSSESRVREWMTAEPVSAPPDASLETALRLMQEHRIHHLPIVEDGRVVGMVGVRAVARSLADRSNVGLGF